MNWETILGVLAILSGVAGLLKYIFYLLDKHKENIDNRFTNVDGRFKEQKNRMDSHDKDIRKNESQLQETRDEMNKDFVRHDHLDKQMNLHGDMLSAIFKKMDGLAKDLNQVIGYVKGKIDDEEQNKP